MASDPREYYKLLNLEPGSGIEEVHLAYGFLKYEWESEGAQPDAKIQKAYECLSNPSRKAAYDSKGAGRGGGSLTLSSSKRMTISVVLLAVLFLFAAFVFPGFLRPAPAPYSAGDRLVRSSSGAVFGEIVRREQFHKFPQEKVGAGYLVRLPDGEKRWFPAHDLERHYRKQ
jgi:curved DNA-binding protein CbpA